MENRRQFLKKSAPITALSLFSGWAGAQTFATKIGDTLPLRQILSAMVKRQPPLVLVDTMPEFPKTLKM